MKLIGVFIFLFTLTSCPSPTGRGVGVRDKKTAFIPTGTNAVRYAVRGATQLKLVLEYNVFAKHPVGPAVV
jgi:hypothetical protein